METGKKFSRLEVGDYPQYNVVHQKDLECVTSLFRLGSSRETRNKLSNTWSKHVMSGRRCPDDDIRSLATSIVNVQKWLRGRYGVLKRVKTISDSYKQSITVRNLVEEASHQEPAIELILDSSPQRLNSPTHLTLEAEVENLRYLWQAYLKDLNSLDKQVNSGQHHWSPLNCLDKQVNSGLDQWSLLKQVKPANPTGCHSNEEKFLDKLAAREFITSPVLAKKHGRSEELADGRFHGNSNPRKRLTYHELKENRDEREEKLLMPVNEDGENGDKIRNFSLEKDERSATHNPTFCRQGNMEPLKELAVQPNKGMEGGVRNKEVTVKIGQDMLDLDIPTEPKRRRMNEENNGSLSNRSSVVSSRSGSPSFLDLIDESRSRSSTPTGTASPCPQTLSDFKKRYKKDALWKSIKSNYQYLMDKEIIEACKLTENDLLEEPDFAGHPNVSFAEFLQHYRELIDWLTQAEAAITKNVSSFSEKYLNQAYHEEMLERCPRRKLFNDYAKQLQFRHPDMTEEISARLKNLNKRWEEMERAMSLRNWTPDRKTMTKDLESDLNSLRRSLNAIEQKLLSLYVNPDWTSDVIELKLKEHQGLQREIESRSKVVSAVLKLSSRLENELESDSETDDGESRQLVAVNLERRWHGIWLLSLEWQCRLEEAQKKKKGIYGCGLDFGNFRLPSLEESFGSENGKDLTNSSYGNFDDSFNFLGCQRDVVGDTPSPTDIARLSLGKSGFLDKSSGDSANISEAESKMEETVPGGGDSNEIISSEGEAEILQRAKNRIESKDIGYSSEGHSNDEAELLRLQMLEDRYQGLVEVASDSPLANETMRLTDSSLNPDYYFMTTVDVDSTDKTTDNDDNGEADKHCKSNGFSSMKSDFDVTPLKMAPKSEKTKQKDDSDKDDVVCMPVAVVTNGNQAVTSEQSESDYYIEPKEKIKLLIDRAEDLVRSPKPFFHSTPDKQEAKVPAAKQIVPTSPSKQTQTLPMETSVVETSCDASGEETDNESSAEDFSTASDDNGDPMVDSVICSDFTSDSRAASQESVSFLSPISPVSLDAVKFRNKTGASRYGRDRPWSFMDVQDIQKDNVKKFSTSDGAIDKLATLSDPDSPCSQNARSTLRHSSSTFPRHRTKGRNHARRCSNMSDFSSARGAKRKLCYPPSSESTCESITDHLVPCPARTDDELTPVAHNEELDRIFANAVLKASSGNSSFTESDTETTDDYDTAPLEPLTSENEDVLNSTGSFSENAWDNYQAPLYPTASEDPTEEPLHWEPTDEMEFDEEICIPGASIINDVMAIQNNAQKKKVKNLPPTNQFEDSDSDIDDFYHILDQSELQLKKADQSLKKKRKDPMGTGLHLKPSKYAEILATCDTNKTCLESICQHITTDAVTDADVNKVQDLLYQWEKLHALATERLLQSQELSAIFGDLADMKSDQRGVQEALNHTSFSCIDDLEDSITTLCGHQELLKRQQSQLTALFETVKAFNEDYPSVDISKYDKDLADILEVNRELEKCVTRQANEQKEKLSLWMEYMDSRKELEYLITEDRQKLQRLLSDHDSGIDKSPAELLNDIEAIQCNLEVYESKLQCLSSLRCQLSNPSHDSTQRDYLASIADLRNQLLCFSQRCKEARLNIDLEEGVRGEEVDLTQYPVAAATILEQVDYSHNRNAHGEATTPESKPSSKKSSSWLSSCPLQLAVLVLTAGLVYLVDPDFIDRITNFSVTISPELKYVNGPPPA